MPASTHHSEPVTGLRLSLNAKICAAATLLVSLSLGITASVIGVKSSASAEAATMGFARIAAREAAVTLQSRVGANLATLVNLAGGMSATTKSGHALTREQRNELIKAVLLSSDDFTGASIAWEPNVTVVYESAVGDAGKPGTTPYWTRAADGSLKVDDMVSSQAPDVNEWYAAPKRTGKVFFTEPYAYSIAGKSVLLASLVAPIVVNEKFIGAASTDFELTRLAHILRELKPIEGSSVDLVSNAGVYVSNADPARVGKKADDIPEAGLARVRNGQAYEYVDAQGMVHLLQPMQVHPDTMPWSVRMSFPRSVATASARELIAYTLTVAMLCAMATAIILVAAVYRLTHPLRSLSAVMENLARGEADLSIRLNARGRDELAAISSGFNQFVEKILVVLRQVRTSANGVADASSEIAQGNADLSSRTEHQASALEQTAASMEELSGAVRQNADSARRANQLAEEAARLAAEGGVVVGQVVETMKGINASSAQIVDIIAVIDSIAFQTNILALNAAVEAARAGEQGRGFAVVASEVRSLASRSAEAAKEIKVLIGASVERVELGTTLVDNAGTAMNAVANSIRRVTDLMGEISTASQEQAEGVAQIDEVVRQMDLTTQQNAALVEEVAAAASSLNAQALELVTSVAVFKLGDDELTPR